MSIKIGDNQVSEMIIHRKDGKGHYTFLSNKQEDGKWDNYPLNVTFRKGIEIEDNTRIRVVEGFMTFYRKEPEQGEEKGKGIPKLVVLEYEVLESRKKENEEEFGNISDDDLPF